MNAEELKRLYWDEGLSQQAIGDKAGVSKTTIQRWMKKHNIDSRTAPKERNGCHILENTRGYEEFKVYDIDTDKRVKIHRLAAVAWFGLDAVVGKDVHHKNECKIDNRESNLEPVTRAEHNRIHG